MTFRPSSTLAVLLLATVACAPAAAPASPAAPSKAAEAPPTPLIASKPVELAKPEASPAAAAASPAASEVRKGGTLRVALSTEVLTLDPHFSTSQVDRHIFFAVFNTLVSLDAQLRAVPELAEAVEQPDPKTVIFKLRKNVKFHDGTDFNAEAVKINFERMMDPNGGSVRRSEVASIDTIDTPDPYTVVLHLKAPDAALLATLTDRAGAMMSPAAIQKYGKDLARNMVGTGPFKFVEWVKDDHITVRKNENYWRQGYPLLDEVIFKPIVDRTVRLTALRTGTLDMVDELAPKDLETARSSADLVVSQLPGIGFSRIQFNTAKPPFDNTALRQAVALAMDRDSIHKVVYSGTGAISQGPIPPSSWAFDPAFKGLGPNADPAKAKAKLAEAGKASGFSFTYMAENDPVQQQLATVIQEQMKQVGIDMKIEVLESAAALTRRSEGAYEALMQAWSGRVDPDGNMYSHYLTGGANNWGKWSNQKADDFLKQARSSTDLPTRTTAYRQAEQIIVDDAAAAFIHHDAWIKAWSKRVRDYQELADGRYRFERVWLAP